MHIFTINILNCTLLCIYFYSKFFWNTKYGVAAAAEQQLFDGCDFQQTLESGKTYNVFSPGYEKNNIYKSNNNCRWMAIAPENHKILLSCDNFFVPMSNKCANDRFEVSTSGQHDLTDAKRYCGIESFKTESDKNKMVLALRVTNKSKGGFFLCDLSTKMMDPTPSTCKCGLRKKTRIVGGVETQVNEFPMMAGLIERTTPSVFCGATIIARNYAVSAAHCMTGRKTEDLALLVGDHNYQSSTDTKNAALYRIALTTIHPEYTEKNSYNDIAVLRTSLMINFNEAVGAICLPFKFATRGDSFVGKAVEVSGWGTTEFGGPLSPSLQKVVLDIIPNSQCTSYYENSIKGSQLCTYRRDKDACQSDSGDPLMYTDTTNSFLYLVGIVSYGRGCASSNPGVNTRLTYFLNWIEANTPGATYCVV